MIRKYILGEPAETDSVIEKIRVTRGPVPYWETDEHTGSMKLEMSDDTRVFGLGETVRGMNKRGWRYVSWCSDDPCHEETKESLYAAQNFFVVMSTKPGALDKGCRDVMSTNNTPQVFGMYIDTPGRVTFDIGYSDRSVFNIVFDDPDAYIYVIDGETATDIVRQFRSIIGPSYIPPKWAFGFGQSRWSYIDADDVRNVADTYDKLNIPLDSIYLDIDYMDHYKDFTVNEEAFGDFPSFVSEMKDRGIRLVPIIDAGVKVEDGYEICDEGVAGDHFVKKEDGDRLVAAVWPGRVYFPDFLREETREWFGSKYRILLDAGIEGFWNDMNEPAIFYTEDRLAEVFDEIDDYRGRDLDINSFFEFQNVVGSLNNNPEDYKRFYHEYMGQKVRHDKVHNLYGYNMTRAAGEAFARLVPDKRILLFSRASYIGSHRYGGVWTGDNRSWWSHLLMNIQQMPGLNMCGFLFSGADTGGFGSDVTEDLLIRWVSFSIFTPLFRDHSARGTREQELYRFPSTDIFRRLINLRYALIPYLYERFLRAVHDNEMLFEPPAFVYPDDERACDVEDQLILGGDIMLAPVYTQNARGRYVYLPENMLFVRFRAYDDYDIKVLSSGDHYIDAALGEVPVFIRPGHTLTLAKPAMRVADIDESDPIYLTCPASE